MDKHLPRLVLLLLLIGFITSSNAQIKDTLYSKYNFLNEAVNKVGNDSLSLNFFYEKLYQLQKNKKGRLNIVHIGDSHLQADFFSGEMRQKLQLKFGNAGRGLIFPFRVAKSNEPSSYKTTTNATWEAKRNVFYEKPLPIGISGFTIETPDPTAVINLTVKDQPGLGYAFTKFTLFHEKGLDNYDISVCDETNCERGVFKSIDKSTNPFVSELRFKKPMQQIMLQNKITDSTQQKTTRIYGMLLENDSAGILYNMIGVNGAEYRHFNLSKYFMQQLPYLSPDLIIISLGTNEAFTTDFNKDKFLLNIDTLISNLKLNNPNASILLTTPGDSFRKSRKGRVKNPDMTVAKEAIIEYANGHNLAYWDLYEVMGGYGSMAKWFTAKLSAKDKVHFSGKGYQMQGDLFYEALIEGYEKYLKTRK